MIQQLINPTISVAQRLRMLKNILAIALLCTLASTYSLWLPDRYYPMLSVYAISTNIIGVYVLLGLLITSLVFIFLFRSPRFFIVLASLCVACAIAFDTSRGQYWILFYLLILLLLCGYNWRVDNAQNYTAVFTAVKMVVAGTYILSAMQFFKTHFEPTAWLQYIKPLENFCTPEQCNYIAKTSYVIPFAQLFVAVALFFNQSKRTAIVVAVCMHLVSLGLLFTEQPFSEAGVIVWHFSMIGFLYALFVGKTNSQQTYSVAFNIYCTAIVVGCFVFYFFEGVNLPQNKIDLLQNNTPQQSIFLSDKEKIKLPLYIQHFTEDISNSDYKKLNITNWVYNETKIKQVLSQNQIQQVSLVLKGYCGADAEIALSLPVKENKEVALNN